MMNVLRETLMRWKVGVFYVLGRQIKQLQEMKLTQQHADSMILLLIVRDRAVFISSASRNADKSNS